MNHALVMFVADRNRYPAPNFIMYPHGIEYDATAPGSQEGDRIFVPWHRVTSVITGPSASESA